MAQGGCGSKRPYFAVPLAAATLLAPAACLLTTDLDGLSERVGAREAGASADVIVERDAPSPSNACMPGFVHCADAATCTNVSGGDNANCGVCERSCADRCVDGLCHVCVNQAEYTNARLACPAGTLVRQVAFASYGTPNGSCGAFVKGACDAPGSLSTVNTLCLGMPSCEIAVANGTFATDPCEGTTKALVAEIVCGP